MIKSTNIGIQTGIKMVKDMSLTGWIRAEMEAREKARRDRFAQDEYIKDEAMDQLIAVTQRIRDGESEENLKKEGIPENVIKRAKKLL